MNSILRISVNADYSFENKDEVIFYSIRNRVDKTVTFIDRSGISVIEIIDNSDWKTFVGAKLVATILETRNIGKIDPTITFKQLISNNNHYASYLYQGKVLKIIWHRNFCFSIWDEGNQVASISPYQRESGKHPLLFEIKISHIYNLVELIPLLIYPFEISDLSEINDFNVFDFGYVSFDKLKFDYNWKPE